MNQSYDIAISALCAWRENRGGGLEGMQSVLNVLSNRVRDNPTSLAEQATLPWQFSSMTATGNPELTLYPSEADASFITALSLAEQAVNGTLEDITGGAQYYFATSMQNKPLWASQFVKTAEIAGQEFYKEA